MANEWPRKSYAGAAVATTLNGAISGVATAIVLTNGSTYPDGTGGPFVICLERGLPLEEKVLCSARSGNNVTALQRGYDGSAAVGHASLVTVEHVLDAWSVDQANAMASAAATVGQIPYRSAALGYAGATPGASGQPLVSGGALAAPLFAALGAAGISATLLELLCPAGSIKPTIAAAADAGYLLVDGSTVVNAQTLYPTLWAKLPGSWKSGSSMVMADMRGRTLIGAGTGAGLTARVLGAANIGEELHLLAASESGLVSHGHAVTDPTHNHGVDTSGGTGAFLTQRAGGVSSVSVGAGGNFVAFTTNTNFSSSGVSVVAVSSAPAQFAHNIMQPSAVVNWQIKVH